MTAIPSSPAFLTLSVVVKRLFIALCRLLGNQVLHHAIVWMIQHTYYFSTFDLKVSFRTYLQSISLVERYANFQFILKQVSTCVCSCLIDEK